VRRAVSTLPHVLSTRAYERLSMRVILRVHVRLAVVCECEGVVRREAARREAVDPTHGG
jgi:hypothetical protein